MERKSIGSFISVLRKAKGMTQQDLALKLNVSNKTVSKWECDETYPDISLIPVIAEILEVSCDELLKGERILYEDKSEKSDKKITKQIKYLVDKATTRFKLYSIINIMFIITGALINLIVSYAAYRPDIGFGVMMGIFVVCIAVEIVALINLNGKFNDKELFENNNGIDFKSTVDIVKYKYSFIFFYLSYFLFFLTLPLILTRIFTHVELPQPVPVISVRVFIQGAVLPVKRVLAFKDYIKLLPYFAVIPVISLSPAQNLYKTIFIKTHAVQINKKTIIFDFVQLALIACSFGVGYYNLYFNTENFTPNTLPVFLLTALIIVVWTLVLFFSRKSIEKDKRFNMLIASARNIIYLFAPLIETFNLGFNAEIAVFLNYLLIIITTTAYAFIVKKRVVKKDMKKN